MTASIERNVYVLRRELPNPIHYVRGTNAISLIFHFRDIEIPSGVTAQVYVRKPSGKEVYNTAVISGSDVTVDVTTQMFIEAGKNILQVQINQGEENLVTFEQPVIVHENYTEGGAEQSENESTLLQQYVDEVAKAAEDAKNEVQNEVANGKNDLDDYVEALKETIPADYTALSESVEQLERNKAPAIIEEASGAEITLDDSGPAPVKDLQLYGYSKQVTTTGAQLIKYSAGTISTSSGATATINENGDIFINGTPTDTAIFVFAVPSKPLSGDYHLSGCPSGGSQESFQLDVRDDKNVILAYDRGDGISFSATKMINSVCVRIAKGYTANNLVFKPMLNSGTSALPWEPYSGGYASPSPDWAQPIHSVADEVNLLDENLYNPESASMPQYFAIKTTAKSITASTNLPRQTSGSAFALLLPGNRDNYAGFTTATNGIYAGRNVTVTPADGYVTIVYLPKNDTSGIKLSDYWIMINSGNTALPWRPYGHNVTVESQGANLIDLPKNLVSSYGGISVKALGDGTFLYSGTATKEAINVWLAGGYRVTTPIITLKGGKYSAPFSEAAFYDYDYDYYLNAINVITVPDGGRDITGIRAPSAVIGTYYNKIIYPMINRGSTPLPWQPYVAPSSALITLTDSLRGIPVTSGGNYTDESGQQWIADYIYRRQTDGKWMLWRNCGKVVYDGSEDEGWTKANNFFRVDKGNFSSASISGKGYSNYYKNITYIEGNSEGKTGFTVINDDVRIYNPTFSDVSSLTQWLSEHNTEIVYPIATPTIEELPDDVQAELNGLYTHNLHTDMWNSDNAHMALKYVADTKSYIDKKISEISEAIIERLN